MATRPDGTKPHRAEGCSAPNPFLGLAVAVVTVVIIVVLAAMLLK